MSNPYFSYVLKKVLPFPVIWFLGGLMYWLIERGVMGDANLYPSSQNVYDPGSAFIGMVIGSLVMGTLMGFLELRYFKQLLKKSPFYQKLIAKSLIYLSLIVVFMAVLSMSVNSMSMNENFFSAEVFQSFLNLVTNFAFLTIIMYISVFIVVGLFISELMDHLGINAVDNFFTGKYQQARPEDRIFMFLDMKSSTTYAEQLGNLKYYDLLRSYYETMTDAILRTGGDVYQYVGDEIIISWPVSKGLQKANCVRCFFLLEEALKNREQQFLDKLGLIPEFKAGLHHGEVTAGEVGEIKKEILFTGDVLNTTARIQSLCNELHAGLLISEELRQLIPDNGSFQFEDKGKLELRGKNEKMQVYAVTRKVDR